MTVAVCQSSCHKAGSGCEKHIREKIKVGDSLEAAQSELTRCGFQTTMDPKATLDPTAKTLYAEKRVTRGIIMERTQVEVKLDSSDRVVSCVVTEGLIGP